VGTLDIESPAMIRFGQMTQDEISSRRMPPTAGVKLTTASDTDPLLLPEHFGPLSQQPGARRGWTV